MIIRSLGFILPCCPFLLGQDTSSWVCSQVDATGKCVGTMIPPMSPSFPSEWLNYAATMRIFLNWTNKQIEDHISALEAILPRVSSVEKSIYTAYINGARAIIASRAGMVTAAAESDYPAEFLSAFPRTFLAQWTPKMLWDSMNKLIFEGKTRAQAAALMIGNMREAQRIYEAQAAAAEAQRQQGLKEEAEYEAKLKAEWEARRKAEAEAAAAQAKREAEARAAPTVPTSIYRVAPTPEEYVLKKPAPVTTVTMPKATFEAPKLYIQSNPQGASISIDGNPTGFTTNGYLIGMTGQHTIKLDKPGYNSMTKTVTISADKDTIATFTLEKTIAAPPAPIPVQVISTMPTIVISVPKAAPAPKLAPVITPAQPTIVTPPKAPPAPSPIVIAPIAKPAPPKPPFMGQITDPATLARIRSRYSPEEMERKRLQQIYASRRTAPVEQRQYVTYIPGAETSRVYKTSGQTMIVPLYQQQRQGWTPAAPGYVTQQAYIMSMRRR